ncbi:MAG: nucleotidyltransferase family protein [Deltaproteobacteria bacterium]
MTRTEAGQGRVAAVILAAGASSRMGEPKQLLPLGGVPLLQHAVDAACRARSINETVVVLGHQAARIGRALGLDEKGRVKVVENPDWSEGMSSSLRVGVAAVSADVGAACLLLGDQPGVGTELIDRVVEAFASCGRPLARPVYRSSAGAEVPGHPVVIGRSLWRQLDGLVGDEGLRWLIASHPDWVHALEMGGEPAADVDEKADYRSIKAGWDQAEQKG